MKNPFSVFGTFFKGLLNTKQASSVNLGFLFFSLLCGYSMFKINDIPDNLMTIVITLALTQGAVTIGSVRKGASGAFSSLINAIKNKEKRTSYRRYGRR